VYGQTLCSVRAQFDTHSPDHSMYTKITIITEHATNNKPEFQTTGRNGAQKFDKKKKNRHSKPYKPKDSQQHVAVDRYIDTQKKATINEVSGREREEKN